MTKCGSFGRRKRAPLNGIIGKWGQRFAQRFDLNGRFHWSRAQNLYSGARTVTKSWLQNIAPTHAHDAKSNKTPAGRDAAAAGGSHVSGGGSGNPACTTVTRKSDSGRTQPPFSPGLLRLRCFQDSRQVPGRVAGGPIMMIAARRPGRARDLGSDTSRLLPKL